ncbi:hypothetical protein [Burkholderia plantarii]
MLAQRLVRQLCPACKAPREEEGRTLYHPCLLYTSRCV